jgi:hypothetical protein
MPPDEIARSRVRQDNASVVAYDDGTVALEQGAVHIVVEPDDVPQFVKGIITMYGAACAARGES